MNYQKADNYTSEDLDLLVIHIEEICKQEKNRKFIENLKILLNRDSGYTRDDNNLINLKLNWIAKYMQIDGYDRIDYSEIKNKNVRFQLRRDCIEMTKYRLGTINYTINFEEFCRYAHLQIEELINYYYSEKFEMNIDNVISYIIKYIPINNKTNKQQNIIADNITEISYYLKIVAFIDANHLGYENKNTLIFLNTLRNEVSHRNSSVDINENEILDKLIINNINIDEYYDKKTLNEELLKLYYKGKFINYKRTKDFNRIISQLNKFKIKIIENLLNKN